MRLLFTFLSLLASSFIFSQQGVAINTDGTAPHASAMLDVKSTSRGLLAPRMTYAQRSDIASPAAGLMVYQTDTYLKIEKGIYLFDGTAWRRLTDLSDLSSATLWTKTGDNQYSAVDGNVGIGTTSPDSKLDVNGALRISGGTQRLNFVTDQAGSDGGFLVYRKSPGIQFIRPDNTVLGRMEYVDTLDFANFLRFHTGSSQSNDFTITSAHAVGIGTNDPQAKLQVSGGAGEQVRIHAASDPILQFTEGFLGNQTKKGYVQVSGDNLRLGTNSGNTAGKFIVRNNGTDRFFIDASGRVGINEDNPQAPLHVVGKTFVQASGEAIKMSGTDPAINIYQGSTQKSYLWQTGNNLRIGISDPAGKIIMVTNQVEIGTSIDLPSDYKLGVGGKVICEELKVKLQSSGWPDYVFDKTYRLKPLSEVEQFITVNKHLPNIPSAKEIEANGIEVGEMQRKMIEKIEELTLYVIELRKELDVLKKDQKSNLSNRSN